MKKTLFTEERRRSLKEASYQSDRAVREKANRIWDGIEALAQNSSELEAWMGDGGVLLSHAAVSTIPMDVAVMLVPSGHLKGGWGTIKGIHVIRVGVLVGPDDLTHVETRIKSARGVFVHEFAHYEDSKRRKGAPSTRKTPGSVGYFQSTSEFNAYYQQVAHEVETSVRRYLNPHHNLPPEIAKRVQSHMRRTLSSFPTFLDHVREVASRSRVIAFDAEELKGTKWERKWIKRLHGLYKALKSEEP